MKAHARRGLLAALVVAAALAVPAAATPPVPQTCDQADSGERLKCKFNNVVEQQVEIAAMIDGLDLLPPDDEQALLAEVDRAQRAQARTEAIEFKQLTKKSKVSCQTKEILGDGVGDDDGICHGNEDCEEVLGDQIGDDDGVCQPRNGNHREVCVEICDDTAVNMDPGNFDDDPAADSRGRDLEATLDGLTARYAMINGMLEDEAIARAAAPRASAGAGACDAVIRRRPSTILVAGLVGATEGSRLTADVAERFCDQTALGFNGSAACAVLETLAGAAKIVSTAFEYENADIDSVTVDNVWGCLKETALSTSAAVAAVGNVGGDLTAVATQVGVVDGRVQTLAQRVAQVDAELDQVRLQIAATQEQLQYAIELLLLPPGQRPGFNHCSTPSDTPNALSDPVTTRDRSVSLR